MTMTHYNTRHLYVHPISATGVYMVHTKFNMIGRDRCPPSLGMFIGVVVVVVVG